jgi:aryl-alcohol dehydrogenase-like predicted oxidoreductase
MQCREFGNTGCQLSVLGFGAAPLGGEYGDNDLHEGRRAVHAAIDAGINFFDVAPFYGRTLAEERLGQALVGKRDQVFLSSKCARFGLTNFDFSAPRVATSVEESMARLQTDHLDLLIVHDIEFGQEKQVLEQAIPAALALRDQGKVRYVGISGLPVQYLRKVAGQSQLDAILSYAHYTLLNDQLDGVLSEYCTSNGVGLINASPLALGLLTENGPPEWHHAPAEVLAMGPRITKLCQQHGQDIAQVALRFALDHPTVATTLVGMSNEAEVAANLAVLEQKSDPELLAKIQTLVAPVHNQTWQEGLPENNA